MNETLTKNIDALESLLKYKYEVKNHEVEKAIKTIQVLHALKTPCTIRDLERLTGRKTATIKNMLGTLSPILNKRKTGMREPSVYQLKAYKELS